MSSNRSLLCTVAAAAILAAAATQSSAQELVHAQAEASGIDTTSFADDIRPQDDFFRFANGGWLQRNTIPADRSSYGAFDELHDASRVALRQLIEEAAADRSNAPGSDRRKVGDLFNSYMDTVAIEQLGVSPVAANLDRIASLSDPSALPGLFAELNRAGVTTPIGLYVGQDERQSDRYIARVSQSGLGLPNRDYYLRSEENFQTLRSEYEKYVSNLLRLASYPNPDQAAASVLALETRLATAQWDQVRNRDREATYNLRSLEELQDLTPRFSWSSYLSAAGAAATPAVVVRQPDYLSALDEELAGTPLQVWKDYLAVRLLDSSSPLLSSDFREAYFEFRGRALAGQEEPSDRWRLALNAVDAALGEATGRIYVEKHFDPAYKARMEDLVGNLVAAFDAGIGELEWMSPATQEAAREKLRSFRVKIGYPDVWEDYSTLEIRPGDLFGNSRRATEWHWEDMVGKLGQPIDREEWGMTPQTVNAYYSSVMNEIVFPAAILQPPFFNPEADDAVNYGAIGAVIGHEISHGFDDQGSRSDGAGNLRDWWTPEDKSEFEERTGALAAQYSEFSPLPGETVNGRLTLGENIGDLSGLAVAYEAYQHSLGGRPAPVIDGLTGDQRFFLGWAQIWRGLAREEALRRQLLTDSHSPGEYRVNGVLRNVPEFYEAFDVREGDGMYLPPAERVKIW